MDEQNSKSAFLFSMTFPTLKKEQQFVYFTAIKGKL